MFEEDEGSPGWVMGRSVAYCQTCYEEKQLTALKVTTSRCTADKSDISCISTPDDKQDQSTTDETSSISSLKRYVNEFEIDRLEDIVDWQQIRFNMTKCSVHIELAYEIVFFNIAKNIEALKCLGTVLSSISICYMCVVHASLF